MSWNTTAASAAAFEKSVEQIKGWGIPDVNKDLLDTFVAAAKAIDKNCPNDKIPVFDTIGHMDTQQGFCRFEFKYVPK